MGLDFEHGPAVTRQRMQLTDAHITVTPALFRQFRSCARASIRLRSSAHALAFLSQRACVSPGAYTAGCSVRSLALTNVVDRKALGATFASVPAHGLFERCRGGS